MHASRNTLPAALITALLLVAIQLFSAIPGHAQTTETAERGAYLAIIAGCEACHSPQDGPSFSGGVVRRQGREVYAPNLTSADAGLRSWTDAQIRTAITTGVRPDGRQLDPVMPYMFYNAMAEDDLNALIVFLRGLEPTETMPSPAPDFSGEAFPPPEPRAGVTAPQPSDPAAYGGYLVEAVLACGSCHTPVLADGRPDPTLTLAGGQAFSGAWGTVYASNLTPDRTSGLLPAMEEEVVLAIVAGRHPEGRPIYAMPWEAYAALSGSDAQAVVTYLYSLDPITNYAPSAELNSGYDQYPSIEREQPGIVDILITTLLALGLGALVVYTVVRQYRQAQSIRDTDWVGKFNEAVSESLKDRAESKEAPTESGQIEPPQP